MPDPVKAYEVAILEEHHGTNYLKAFEHPNWKTKVETDLGVEDAAELAAQKAYDDWAGEDGDCWPLTFLVADPEGDVTKVEVDMELEPTFWSDVIEENAAHLKQ